MICTIQMSVQTQYVGHALTEGVLKSKKKKKDVFSTICPFYEQIEGG